MYKKAILKKKKKKKKLTTKKLSDYCTYPEDRRTDQRAKQIQ